MFLRLSSPSIKKRSFTLPELLVATALLMVLTMMLFPMVSQVSSIWQHADSTKSRQQNARLILSLMSRDLESMVLPLDVTSQVSLQFVINSPALTGNGLSGVNNASTAFWQASLPGNTKDGDIFEVGYFVRWSTSSYNKIHSDLCRLSLSPTNALSIFQQPNNWLSQSLIDTYAPGSTSATMSGLVAENVIALWITPYNKNGTALAVPYDSRKVNGDTMLSAASVEIAIVQATPQVLQHLASSALVTSHYSESDVDSFVAHLPDSVRNNVTVYKNKVSIQAFRTVP
jgi:hypothetical protein